MPRRSRLSLTSSNDPPERTLTLLQKRFADEYAIDMNATAAAQRAGCSDPSYGRLLISLPHVQEAVRRAAQERNRKLELSADRVLRQFMRWAYFDPASLFREDGTLLHPKEMDADTRACVSSIDVEEETTVTTVTSPDGQTRTDTRVTVRTKKIRTRDAVAAGDRLMRHLGLMVDVRLVSGRVQIDHAQAREGMRAAMSDPAARQLLDQLVAKLADGHAALPAPVTVESEQPAPTSPGPESAS